jgi:hypothetical protein
VALSPQTFSGAGWIPVGSDPNVIQQVQANSFVETFGISVPMSTRTEWTPRSGGVKMQRAAAGSGGYAHDTSGTNDSVLLTLDKFGVIVDLEYEDLKDANKGASIIKTKTTDAAASYARLFDNVCVGVTAAKGTSGWNFDSLLYLLGQSESATGYTGGSNIVTAATAGKATYVEYSNTLGKVEASPQWYDPGNVVVGAHPLFRNYLRGVLDLDGRPIFLESSNGGAAGASETGSTLFGYPLRWSHGLIQSAAGVDPASSGAALGRPLMVIGNRNLIKRGDGTDLESRFADADSSGYGFDSDVSGLKFRARKSFAPGALPGFAILVG